MPPCPRPSAPRGLPGPPRRRPRPPRAGAFVPWLVVAGVAGAYALAGAAPPPRARLTYERRPGAERCPDEDALRRAVATRLGYDPFRDDAPVTIAAAIEGRGAALRARVTRLERLRRRRGD